MWILCKISITHTVHQDIFLLRKISIVGIPKSTVLVIIFKVFMWPLSLINVVPQSIIHLKCFKMVSKKNTRSSVTGKMGNGINFSSLDSTMAPNKNKSLCATFRIQMKNIVYLLKHRMMNCLWLIRKTCLYTEAIKSHSEPGSGKKFSPATWLWNGALWSPWRLKCIWNCKLWSPWLPLRTY